MVWPMEGRIAGFAGELIDPNHPAYDSQREIWNAMVDRRPALIARCTSADDVVAALRHGRDAGLDIAVRCGGHGVLGLSVPDDGLMIDLAPMGAVRVDPQARRAWVQGGSLLRNLDRATEPHGLATTAGNVSHTGVGGLTLGGGMGWLARQFGMACDNVATYTVVTADGGILRASADENPDLFWGLRGGGGNFGIVTEFEFRLHPISHRVVTADFYFDPTEAAAKTALRAWRELLTDAPREATLTSDLMTAGAAPFLPTHLVGRSIVSVGFVWVGDVAEARRYLAAFRAAVGGAVAEHVGESSYLELQSAGDEGNRHGLRRYFAGHYLTDFSDAAIDAYLSRGLGAADSQPDWALMPNGGFQAYGGAIAEVPDDASAFSHRRALIEFGAGATWLDPAEDAVRMGYARRWAQALAPFSSGVYVNAIGEAGEDHVGRAYAANQLTRLARLKAKYDPNNVFHFNQNIKPAAAAA